VRGRILTLVAVTMSLAAIAAMSWRVYTSWRKPFQIAPYRPMPVSDAVGGRIAIRVPGRYVVAELASYQDELFAYLMFDYLRAQPLLRDTELLITYSRRGGRIAYPIVAVLPNDFLTSMPKLYESVRPFPFLTPEWFVIGEKVLIETRSRTQTLVAAYRLPTYRKFERLSRQEVIAYTARFIRFKSSTDARVRRQIEPAPRVLSREEADQLAEDIVTVADFFSLPLDFFLGIGAMENNYMNVKGDLGHAVWKRRADKGDVILARRGRRVFVLDEASGVWQITNETLRYAHSLFLKDGRDYGQLPERLRPSRELDPSGVETAVLTTYAGILFRDLLDRFGGDVALAVGAYNGGPGRPNPQYEGGVRLVADYARRVMEQAAALRGERLIEVHFKVSDDAPDEK
jgi:hypothetical protein